MLLQIRSDGEMSGHKRYESDEELLRKLSPVSDERKLDLYERFLNSSDC